MNDKLLSAITFVLLLAGAGTIGYVGLKTYLHKVEHQELGELGCVAHRETLKMEADGMTGLVEKDELFEVLHGYYKCNPVKEAELVFFTPSPTIKASVKKIWGLPGDSFALTPASNPMEFEILINQQKVVLSDGALTLTEKEAQALKSFEIARNGVLGADEFIIFGNKKPLVNDSSRFGIVKSNHFKGRVVEAD